MADNFSGTTAAGALQFATDDIAGVHYPRSKIGIGADGEYADVSAASPLPVGGTVALASATVAALTALGLTDQQLRAAALAVAGIRRDADTAFTADGGAHPFMFNSAGRLKVSASPADLTAASGSITASGGIVAVPVVRLSNLSITMVATTLVGHNIAFEFSNNSTNGTDGNWYSVQVVRTNANTVETASGVLAATPTYGWNVNVSDYQWFRVRATAHTSGTAAYVLSPSAYASEPIPSAQVTAAQPVTGTFWQGTQPVSGTVTATVTNGTVTATPNAGTGLFVNSAASVNAGAAKATAGSLMTVTGHNAGAAAAYVRFYNKATAPITTDIPALIMIVPPGGSQAMSFGFTGQRFPTGIAYNITGGAADADATAVAAGQVKLALTYI